MTARFNYRLTRFAAASLLLCCGAAQAATAGTGTWSAEQTWAADTVNGGNLKGFFYWPATQPLHSTGKRALILVLHGCTQTAKDAVINDATDGGFNWKTTADKYGAVVLAPNATGNVYSNHCWDYANTNHTRTSGHNYVLLDLVNRFKNDPKYAIDPNQVYVTGLSSGGGETMALGCLAPDVFAGTGINAGPALGTPTSAISYVPAGVTASSTATNCKKIAGTSATSFNTQITSVVWGDTDYIVTQAYGPMNAEAMRLVYGGTYSNAGTVTVTDGPGGAGTAILYKDANDKLRTSQMSVKGMAHAWPAGPGGQNISFVDNTRVNYPAYVTDFWFKNNLRAGGSGTTTTTAAGTTTTAIATTTTITPATTTTTSTSTTTTAAATCYTSSNYAHVSAGRAYNSGGYAKANGSNQNMGLNNVFYIKTLKKTGANYYVIGSC